LQVVAAVRNLPQFISQTIPAAIAAFFVWLYKTVADRLFAKHADSSSSSQSAGPVDASSAAVCSIPVQEQDGDIVYHQTISSRPSSPTPHAAALAAAAVAGPAAAAVLEQAAAARSVSPMQLVAEDDEQQQLREADAAELEFSLCLRLKNQPAAAQDEQQEPAAQLQQRALFGAKLGPASSPGEQPVCCITVKAHCTRPPGMPRQLKAKRCAFRQALRLTLLALN
jgi:hypothetical protein